MFHLIIWRYPHVLTEVSQEFIQTMHINVLHDLLTNNDGI